MTVKDLISKLEKFDGDTIVIIGEKDMFSENHGLAMDIDSDIDIQNITPIRANKEDYKAVVITRGYRVGDVYYN